MRAVISPADGPCAMLASVRFVMPGSMLGADIGNRGLEGP
jgi:hypothetical protein